MRAINLTSGDRIVLNFKKKGWFSSKDYSVSGEVMDCQNKVL